MNPDNKNLHPTPPQPNYNFIINQPTVTEQNKPKKRDPRILIIVVLFVVTIVILVAGALLSAKNNVAEQPSDSTTSTITPESKSIIDNFFSLVSKNDVDGAYDQTVDSSSQLTKDVFLEQVIPVLTELDLSKCAQSENISEFTDESGGIQVAYVCDDKVADSSTGITFFLKTMDGNTKITGIVWSPSDVEIE